VHAGLPELLPEGGQVRVRGGQALHPERGPLGGAAGARPGNLLGNLFCAVAGLLDGSLGLGALLDIADLINRSLRILRGVAA
jgi:hypothetical protein